MSSSGYACVYHVDKSPINPFIVQQILEDWSDIPDYWKCETIEKDGVVYGIAFRASKYGCIYNTIHTYFEGNPDSMIAIDAGNEDDFYVNRHYVFYLDGLTSFNRNDIIFLHEIPEPVVYRRKKLTRLLKWLKRHRLKAIDKQT